MAESTIKNLPDVSKYVRRAVESNPDFTYTALAEKLSISKNGMNTRLNKKHYGTVYDLLETCIYLRKDLISPLLEVLINHDIEIELKNGISNEQMEELKALKEENELLKKTLSKLV